MKVSAVISPEATLTGMEQQYHLVGKVGFYLQRYRTAIDKCIPDTQA